MLSLPLMSIWAWSTLAYDRDRTLAQATATEFATSTKLFVALKLKLKVEMMKQSLDLLIVSFINKRNGIYLYGVCGGKEDVFFYPVVRSLKHGMS